MYAVEGISWAFGLSVEFDGKWTVGCMQRREVVGHLS